MKKILFSILTFTCVNISLAQEAADKKIQAGLTTGFGLNFTNPTTKYIARNGVGTDLTVGMILNYNYTPTIGISTGIEFDFETIKYKSNSATGLYYVYNDSEILKKSQYIDGSGVFTTPAGKYYTLSERKIKPIYLTIPTMMLFRTKFIGYSRYFGKFGLRNSFLLSSTIFDKGSSFDASSNIIVNMDNENMKSSIRDLSFYKGSIGISAGTEWNFSGTTSLVAELGYYYGFLNISRGSALTGDKEKNMTVYSSYDQNGYPTQYTSFPAKQNQLLLKVSILF